MRKIYAPLLVASLFVLPKTSYQQTALTNATYTQNFNTLNSAATASDALPQGWMISEVGTATAADGKYVGGTGSGNAGNVYSFGLAGSEDRALGGLLSGTLTPTIGVAFTNNTGKTITSLQIAYTGEQWRLGALNREDRLDFQYSLNAGSLLTGDWNHVDQLDFVAPTTAGTVGALDGNAAQNRREISFTLSGFQLPAGATIYFRWTDFNAAGADDGLALDDFSVSTGAADAEAPQVASLNPSEGATAVLPSVKPTITFDETVAEGSGNIVVTNTTTGVAQTITVPGPQVAVSANKLVINVKLQPNQQYQIQVDAGVVKDAAGNDFSGTGAWSFATGEQQLVFNFNDCNNATLSGGFTQYSISGAQTWRCSTFGANNSSALQINGFSSGAQLNEDWLISPSFDLSYFSFPVLSFTSRTEFAGPDVKLMVSTNYDGLGNPADAAFTWTAINGYFGATGEWNTTTGLNLSDYKGDNVHLAFVYTSSPALGAARWTIDDVQLVNSATAPAPVVLFGPKELELDYAKIGTYSEPQAITWRAYNLVADLTINAPQGFQVSADGIEYGATVTLSKAAADGQQGQVFIRFAPTVADKDFSGAVTITSGDLLLQATQLSGTSLRALKVVNWNIEWFGSPENGPSNKDVQQQNVQTILRRLNADVYALSEVVDDARLKAVVDAMPGYAYTISDFGSYTDNVADPDYPTAQKLAFVYRTDVVKNLSAYGVLRTGGSAAAYRNWSSGRFPYMMQAAVNLDGVAATIHFALLHAKANTGSNADQVESWERRKGGADELKDSLDVQYPFANVLLLGDFNDDLDVTIAPNIPGNITSYISFMQDGVDYKPITLPLSLAGQRSTASYDNVIDHQLASNEMGVAYVPQSARILTGVSSWVSNYSSSTSDHFPVMARYDVRYFQNPIAFRNFAGVVNGAHVDFNWNTTHEINSAYFVVERSRNGVDFTAVDSVAGLGSRREGRGYVLSLKPWPGKTHYRLRVTGLDGSVQYSAMQTINIKESSSLLGISMSGNAVATISCTVAAEGQGTLQLLDLNGKLFRTQQGHFTKGKNVRYFNTQHLPAGVYLVRLVQNGTVVTEKVYIGK